MPADRARLDRIGERTLAAWNEQDVEAVVACYTDDCVYLDPNTRGPVVGRDALRAYLRTLFGRWDMHWEALETFPLEGLDATAFRWSATLAPAGRDDPVRIDGVDLVFLEGELLRRNEVFYDRTPLVAFLAAAPA
jgi:hypothetical protein